jgi:hypothetical protein
MSRISHGTCCCGTHPLVTAFEALAETRRTAPMSPTPAAAAAENERSDEAASSSIASAATVDLVQVPIRRQLRPAPLQGRPSGHAHARATRHRALQRRVRPRVVHGAQVLAPGLHRGRRARPLEDRHADGRVERSSHLSRPCASNSLASGADPDYTPGPVAASPPAPRDRVGGGRRSIAAGHRAAAPDPWMRRSDCSSDTGAGCLRAAHL